MEAVSATLRAEGQRVERGLRVACRLTSPARRSHLVLVQPNAYGPLHVACILRPDPLHPLADRREAEALLTEYEAANGVITEAEAARLEVEWLS